MRRSLLVSALVGVALSGCSAAGDSVPTTPAAAPSSSTSSGYASPVVAGHIEADEIKESSGLSASECQDVLWTLNDSGNEPLLFALDTTGRRLGTWRVRGAENQDWESVASYRDPGGRCALVIGDIGDNDEQRSEVRLYRIPEPTVSAAAVSATAKGTASTEPAQTLALHYPDGPHNAETLLVHPRTGQLYVVTKEEKGPAEVFRVEPRFGATATGAKVGEVSVPSKPKGRLTDGAFSPDGTRVMLCDEQAGYELVLPAGAAPDTIWNQPPRTVDLGDRPQGEGVSYSRDGDAVYASSEKKNSALYLIRRK
jgi:hypothetical protein